MSMVAGTSQLTRHFCLAFKAQRYIKFFCFNSLSLASTETISSILNGISNRGVLKLSRPTKVHSPVDEGCATYVMLVCSRYRALLSDT